MRDFAPRAVRTIVRITEVNYEAYEGLSAVCETPNSTGVGDETKIAPAQCSLEWSPPQSGLGLVEIAPSS